MSKPPLITDDLVEEVARAIGRLRGDFAPHRVAIDILPDHAGWLGPACHGQTLREARAAIDIILGATFPPAE